MARAWLGISHMRLGHYDEAAEVFRGTIDLGFRGVSDNFGGEDMDVLAATYLFELGARREDRGEMERWLTHLEQTHPGREEIHSLRARLASPETWD